MQEKTGGATAPPGDVMDGCCRSDAYSGSSLSQEPSVNHFFVRPSRSPPALRAFRKLVVQLISKVSSGMAIPIGSKVRRDSPAVSPFDW